MASPITRPSLPSSLGGDLRSGLGKLRLDLPQGAEQSLLDYIALLAKWNRTYNLTSIRDPARMLTHHVLDALAALPHLPDRPSMRILDVGSGGGVPGIPWAIARPRWEVVLVEANGKKAAFLVQAAIELHLANVQARESRVEALSRDERFDVITSRAFSDLATFASLSSPLLASGGVLAAMKGEMPVDEIAALPPSIEVIEALRLVVPGLDAARHLVLMRACNTAA